MNIGIVGNYGNKNHGDEAILEGIIIQLEQTFDIKRKEITVFSKNPAQTMLSYDVNAVPLFVKKKSAVMKLIHTFLWHRRRLREFDFIIIGGGGILMDLYRNGIIVFGFYSWMANHLRIPTIVYGPGVGPISTRLGKRINRYIGNHAEMVMVRDEQSKKLLQKIGVQKPIEVVLDPAFHLPFSTALKPGSQANDKINVGVTAVPYFDEHYWPTADSGKYDAYTTSMARNLDRLLASHSNVNVNFFATKFPFDRDTAADIQALMAYKSRTTLCERELNHQEIIDFIDKQDLVIGTRLHSLILTLVAKTPLIAVSYHHKVRDVMEMAGCLDCTVSLADIENEDTAFENIFENLIQDWDKTRNRFGGLVGEMQMTSFDGMAEIRQAYPLEHKVTDVTSFQDPGK